MLLTEFIYFNNTDSAQHDNARYSPSNDKSVLSLKDTRKTRLTLKMLSVLRKAGDAREQETLEDLAVIQTMYAAPPAEAA